MRKTLRILSLFLLCAALTMADPITGVTGWFHNAVVQAGSDLIVPFIIIGAAMGLMRGWQGVMAGAFVGLLVAIFIGNAPAIQAWAKTITLS